MNVKEYLLSCLIEELAEVQKELVKCLRFSPEHVSPHDQLSNITRVGLEYSDVIAITEMLEEEGISIPLSSERVNEKKERTKRMMFTSRKIGVLR